MPFDTLYDFPCSIRLQRCVACDYFQFAKLKKGLNGLENVNVDLGIGNRIYNLKTTYWLERYHNT